MSFTVNLIITALSVMLFATFLHINRIKCLLAVVLGCLLNDLVYSLAISFGIALGFLGTVITVVCITLVAWLIKLPRIRSLIANILGVLLSGWLCSLIMPILHQIFG